jgi:hypothetical protein
MCVPLLNKLSFAAAPFRFIYNLRMEVKSKNPKDIPEEGCRQV